jgi:oligogalacturonide lyase
MTRKTRLSRFLPLLALSTALALPAFAETTAAPPKSWIDPDTGHRVIRLTDEPNTASIYFNINAFTPDGKQMIYTAPDRGIAVMDLATFTSRPLVKGPVGGGPGAVVVGHKTPTVYYFKASEDPQVGALWATDIDTGATRKIADLPRRAGIFSINADETLGVGSYIVGDGEDYAGRQAGQVIAKTTLAEPKNKSDKMATRLAARLPMIVFSLDLKTGERKPVFASTDWIDHLQFSPTDPTLLMYAHQGAWQQVDKLWTIRIDGSHNTQIDKRTMLMEGSGHQWFAADGKTIWYDLHIPTGLVSYVAGYDVESGDRTWYYYQPKEASIHFNRSADGTLFAGDGSAAPDAQWIYLFRPELVKDDHTLGEHLIRPGVLHAEHLVNMAKHQYHLEPNVYFTPDQKWVIFRSNMFGKTYMFAVEVAKASK